MVTNHTKRSRGRNEVTKSCCTLRRAPQVRKHGPGRGVQVPLLDAGQQLSPGSVSGRVAGGTAHGSSEGAVAAQLQPGDMMVKFPEFPM